MRDNVTFMYEKIIFKTENISEIEPSLSIKPNSFVLVSVITRSLPLKTILVNSDISLNTGEENSISAEYISSNEPLPVHF